MQQFQLGPKAIQTIEKIQSDLNRFPRRERASILRYLNQSLTAGTTTNVRSLGSRRVVRATTTSTTARAGVRGKVKTKGWSSRQAKLSQVAKKRKRDASGHFVPSSRRRAA
jgi:hypothetical protein